MASFRNTVHSPARDGLVLLTHVEHLKAPPVVDTSIHCKPGGWARRGQEGGRASISRNNDPGNHQ